MTVRKFVQEASKLAEKSSDGTYDCVIITEGVGSTGVYSAELLERSVDVFENAPSYLNHPTEPWAPQLRPVESIAGRITNVRLGEDAGRTALVGKYKPRAEYASLFEEFGDLLGLSIYCGASGEELPNGRIEVSAFDDTDPYKAVDVVVAAGRGGRFKRAEESLRRIESSLGIPRDAKPAAEASAEEKEGENMEEVLKAVEALAKTLEPVVSFVTESAAKREEEAQTEVDAEALATARAEGAKAAAESFAAVDAAELPAKIAESLKAKVLEGKDVTDAIADAKAVLEAAAEAAGDEPGRIVIESAGSGSSTAHDWSL
ncbi:hypothetical protein [Microbacterium sp.]|uniref:hypothetical protein n=1 Tax=Microbacterium sp. TaxID=51671 RepID=UPI0039E3EE8D